MDKKSKFIPALKFNFLTRFFDPLMKITMFEKKFKNALLFQSNIRDNDTVLDFGCGTGTLALMAKKSTPETIIHGVDIDQNILKIAQTKAVTSNLEVFLNYYDGTSLPYKNEMFDKILSSLVFHHLLRNQKLIALNEIYRILKVGGELHILDFGKARNIFARGAFLPIQLFDGFSNTSDNIKGLLPKIIREAGFNEVVENKQILTPVGPISLYKAIK